MTYRPGKDIISSLQSNHTALLSSYQPFLERIHELIHKFKLKNLGEVCHNFPSGGFTAVVCLSESHISIHTWPEYGLVNLDIYLSNFERDNDGTVESIYRDLCTFFESTIKKEQILVR